MGSAAQLPMLSWQADRLQVWGLLVKKIIAILALLASGSVLAQQPPTIIGHINNRDNGQIVFTTDQGQCNDGTRLAYIEDDGGKIYTVGCWRKTDNKIFVVWSSGEIFSYNIEKMNFTREWMDYSNR